MRSIRTSLGPVGGEEKDVVIERAQVLGKVLGKDAIIDLIAKGLECRLC